MTVHELKCWPQFFEELLTGAKTFEVRRADRDFKVGDVLHLREWDPATKAYTGRDTSRGVSYVSDLNGMVSPGFIAMGFMPMFKASPGTEAVLDVLREMARHDRERHPVESERKPPDRRRELVRAAALLIQQIEKFDRDAAIAQAERIAQGLKR